MISLVVTAPPAEARNTPMRQKQEESARLYQEQLKKMEQKLEEWEKAQK